MAKEKAKKESKSTFSAVEKAKTVKETKQPVANSQDKAVEKEAKVKKTKPKPEAEANVARGKRTTKATGKVIEAIAGSEIEIVKPEPKTKSSTKTSAKKPGPQEESNELSQELGAATDRAATTEEKLVQVTFQLKYSTHFGQRLAIAVNGNIEEEVAMEYFNNEYWTASLRLPASGVFKYKYSVADEHGAITMEAGRERTLAFSNPTQQNVLLIETWNNLNNEDSFQSSDVNEQQAALPVQNYNHFFAIKASPLPPNYVPFISGSIPELGNWTEENIQLLSKNENGEWSIQLDLNAANLVAEYKYGLYDLDQKQIIALEGGPNRTFYRAIVAVELSIVRDGFIAIDFDSLRIAV